MARLGKGEASDGWDKYMVPRILERGIRQEGRGARLWHQGHAAQNLKNSGGEVTVGLYKNGSSWGCAERTA